MHKNIYNSASKLIFRKCVCQLWIHNCKFRTNQTATLLRAIQGESVFLTSRIGDFKLVPVSVEEKIATRIREGLNEVKRIEAGEQPAKSANAFLDEL